MVRNLTQDQNDYLSGNSLISVLLIEIAGAGTAGATVYFTDAAYDLVFDGNTYLAQGTFLSVSATEENADLAIVSATIVLSALTAATVTSFATSTQINKSVVISRGLINFSNNQLLGDSAGENVIVIFKGKISGYSVSDRNNSAEISIQVSSQFINFDKRTGRKTNPGNFQIEHPNDFSMDFSSATIKDLKWGKV